MGSWTDVLRVLADMALPEQWDFQDSPVKNFYILRQYLKYTFLRLQHEDKVLINDEGTFAAFNTGLLTIHYDDIYACFEKNHDPTSAIPWRFSSFCTEGSRGDGQRITIYFTQAPQPAELHQRGVRPAVRHPPPPGGQLRPHSQRQHRPHAPDVSARRVQPLSRGPGHHRPGRQMPLRHLRLQPPHARPGRVLRGKGQRLYQRADPQRFQASHRQGHQAHPLGLQNGRSHLLPGLQPAQT